MYYEHKGKDFATYGKQGKGNSQYKTTICKFWAQGMCMRGAGCTFAHGEQDMLLQNKGKGRSSKEGPIGAKPGARAAPHRQPPGAGEWFWPSATAAEAAVSGFGAGGGGGCS